MSEPEPSSRFAEHHLEVLAAQLREADDENQQLRAERNTYENDIKLKASEIVLPCWPPRLVLI